MCVAIDPCATVLCSRRPCPAGWTWEKVNPTDCCEICIREFNRNNSMNGVNPYKAGMHVITFDIYHAANSCKVEDIHQSIAD